MTESKSPSFIQSLLPVLILIVLLFLNVKYFEDPIGGANQIALFIAAIIGGLIGWHNKVKWENMQRKIVQTIHSAMTSILILLLIGALSGAWMISGVIPMMIYYGVDIMHPSYFLLATVILCSIVSLATGSSWSTIATVGVAIIGIGNAFGLNPGLVAGAIISGAYFGDKMSPLSDTTNLAPAIAGTDLFTHIRYMIYTTGPTMILTLVIFAVIGLFHWSDNTTVSTEFIKEGIAQTFHISPFLLIVPLALIIIIIKKYPHSGNDLWNDIRHTLCPSVSRRTTEPTDHGGRIRKQISTIDPIGISGSLVNDRSHRSRQPPDDKRDGRHAEHRMADYGSPYIRRSYGSLRFFEKSNPNLPSIHYQPNFTGRYNYRHVHIFQYHGL